jgi:hypothetical protein
MLVSHVRGKEVRVYVRETVRQLPHVSWVLVLSTAEAGHV